MTNDELVAISDEIEREIKDHTLWQETPESAALRPEREKWFEENMTYITLVMPNKMLNLLQAAAAVEGIGYHALIKKWLHQHLLSLRSKET